jgi:hypothetical protein
MSLSGQWGKRRGDEERLEIECPDCGKKLMVLRIARSCTIEAAPVREPQDDRRAYSLREVAEKCGVSYSVLWRAAARGDIKVLKGFGRIMISGEELKRFLSKSEVYKGKGRTK